MRKWVGVALGGGAGAVLRYLIRGIVLVPGIGGFPLNTLLINVAGSFALSLLLTAAGGIFALKPELRLALTTGFLGAFTTFSTVCREMALLLSDGSYGLALLYVLCTVLLGLLGAYGGYRLGSRMPATPDAPEEEAKE